MGELSNRAVDNHRNHYPCSAAVLCAFAEDAGLSEPAAREMAMPFAGGRMGKCGAVLAAERVIERKYGPERAETLIKRFEEAFEAKNQSVVCAELRGRGLRTCRGCVQDAAEILEEMLDEQR